MVLMIESQAEIDHSRPFRDNLGPATKAGQEMSNVAVVALDGNREVLAGEQLFRGDQPMISVPVVGGEGHPLRSIHAGQQMYAQCAYQSSASLLRLGLKAHSGLMRAPAPDPGVKRS